MNVDVVKTVGGIIVSIGVNVIVGNVIKCTSPSSVGIIRKVCTGIGGFVLASMVSDTAVTYTEHKIDSAMRQIKDAEHYHI